MRRRVAPGTANWGLRSSLALVLSSSATVVHAAPGGGSAEGSIDTKTGASASGEGKGRTLPERVIAGNALSVMLPFQIGAVGYLPRARLALQYDRQLHKGHWVYLGAGMLFDYGDWNAFRLDDCWPGVPEADPVRNQKCGKGAVLGFDVYLGYVYRWYLEEHPYLVPMVRLGGGFEWWKYPGLRSPSAREQERDRTWTLNLRPGGGVRFFFRDDLGVGIDVNIPIGFAIHTDRPLDQDVKDRSGAFLLGFEILVPNLEYRF